MVQDPHPPSPPPQTLTRKFSKSRLAKEWKKIFLVDLSISWNFLHFWFRCDFWCNLPSSPPQTLTKKFCKSRLAKQLKKKKLVDLSISWNFLYFWFRWDFWPPPPPPPPTLTWNFLSPCIFGSGVIFEPHPPHHHLKLWQKNFLSPRLAKQFKKIF